MNRITIRKTAHQDGTRAAYRGGTLIATISHEKPSRANNRPDAYGVHWLTGRTDWHSSYSDARDNVLKG